MTKTSHYQPLQRTSSLQPWIRDHYAALRAEAGPRLHQTRAVVVPVIMDTSHKVRDEVVPKVRDELVPKVRDELVPKVRDEYVPAAVHLSSRVAEEAMQRSAPLRAELSDRAAATVAAARGQISAAQLGQLGQLSQLKRHKNDNRKGRSHRKLWIISGAAAAGAAVCTAAVLWQRSRYQAWVEDDATQSAMDDTPEPERLNTDPNHNHSSDGAENVHASSGGQREDGQQWPTTDS